MGSRVRWFVVVCALALGVAPAARADGPGVGTPTIVTLGDSAISGEAGRWAGNTNMAAWRVDALGPDAYRDTPAGEAIPGCHRSRSAQAHIGGEVESVNLACSGARTRTTGTGAGDSFKPGIDFYGPDASGRKGQARMLQEIAGARNVRAVVVMIGANDYGFGAIVERCLTNWLTSPWWWRNYCHDDADIASRFTAERQAQITTAVRDAFARVSQAMTNAGYDAGQYSVIAQTYWTPIPPAAGFRYPQSGWTRQVVGGCGIWNRDADWAHDTVVEAMNGSLRNGAAAAKLPNLVVLDLQRALDGRRLCESTVGLLEEVDLRSWRSAGAVDRTEWVSQIRTATTILGPYQLQEGSHASYWGQLAMRSCLRQAYNGGAVRGGTCLRVGDGLTADGEPRMGLF